MFGLGTTELLIVAGLIILFFGARKVSDLAKNVAEGIQYLKGGFSSEEERKDKANKNR
ncbi:MAG: twin-arginine translocase TatA/TatE family subunit [Candidatus Paceibacterota bacterium]|jgi:sec-independent protein translocase protein TatA